MTAIRNIAIAGASGDLGTPILHALISSNVFNITVLTRDSSKAQFPPSTRVIRVDYTSIPSLTAALLNQDAVISALTSSAMDTQDLLIKASIAAGVKRFIPSEFSSNIGNPKSSLLPVYQSKIAVHELLKRLSRENPGFTYTLIRNGPFLDWCLMKGVFVDFKGTTTPFYDGGGRRFSTTTLDTIGRAVVGVLLHLDETKNRAVFVHDLVTTQREIPWYGGEVGTGADVDAGGCEYCGHGSSCAGELCEGCGGFGGIDGVFDACGFWGGVWRGV